VKIIGKQKKNIFAPNKIDLKNFLLNVKKKLELNKKRRKTKIKVENVSILIISKFVQNLF
jgi:hypothetical protein